MRPAYFVPESKHLDDLLRELQQQHIHMAIVVDEYGSVAGLVTIEDLVEEIIGDIQDEYDREEQLLERISDNEYLVNAKISLDELNEELDTNLSSEDYETLGGFVYGQLDKIPTVGDVVHAGDLTMTVMSTRGRRVTKVRLVRQSSDQAGPDEGGPVESPPQAGPEQPGQSVGQVSISPALETPLALPPASPNSPAETPERRESEQAGEQASEAAESLPHARAENASRPVRARPPDARRVHNYHTPQSRRRS